MEQKPDFAFTAGLTAHVELTVTDSDTAQAAGSGDVPVLGTPRALALMEAATVAATASRMPSGMTTVGIRVELDHRAPTPVGHTVVARARLAKVDGRRLLFEVSLHDGATVAAEGRVERMLVERRRFVERAFGHAEGTERPAAAANAGPDGDGGPEAAAGAAPDDNGAPAAAAGAARDDAGGPDPAAAGGTARVP